MSDNLFDITQAQRLWQNSRNGLFDFAEYLVNGADEDIHQLAKKVRRTPSLLYGYRKAGKFWLEVKAEFPQAEMWRDHLEIGFWVPLARLWDNGTLDLSRCVDYLMEADRDKELPVEFFKDKLPLDGRKSTGIVRSLSHLITYTEKYIFRAPSLGLNCKQDEYNKFIKLLTEAVEYGKGLLAARGGQSRDSSGD